MAGFLLVGSLGEDALLLKRADRAGTKSHSNLLAINYKSLLLEVRLKDAVGATQREANIVAKLLSFTGEFASCCHNYSLFPVIFRTLGYILPFYLLGVKRYPLRP